MSDFNKNDWCWQLPDGRVWGTKAAAFVDEAGAAAWLAASGLAAIPPSPADEAGEWTETGLRMALAFYGLPLGELMSLAEAKAAKLAEVIAACDAALEPLASSYSAMERSTWDQQVSEAGAYLSDAGASAPLLRAIAEARGIEVADLAKRVMGNKSALELISGAVLGQKQGYEDVLAAITDETPDAVSRVSEIAVSYRLPGLA